MLANNLANSGTAGFKADREFNGLFQESLPVVERHWTDFSQGDLMPTGDPLNLALDGKGFFALTTPAGIAYTRNGQIRISKTNELETPEGFKLRNVRDDQRRPITVDPAVAISIDRDGVVTQAGRELGQIEILNLEQASLALRKQGTSYLALDKPGIRPAAATNIEVRQGMLEQSNVPLSDSAVRLVSVMRQFEMLQRAMTLGSEMNRKAIDEVARVS